MNYRVIITSVLITLYPHNEEFSNNEISSCLQKHNSCSSDLILCDHPCNTHSTFCLVTGFLVVHFEVVLEVTGQPLLFETNIVSEVSITTFTVTGRGNLLNASAFLLFLLNVSALLLFLPSWYSIVQSYLVNINDYLSILGETVSSTFLTGLNNLIKALRSVIIFNCLPAKYCWNLII